MERYKVIILAISTERAYLVDVTSESIDLELIVQEYIHTKGSKIDDVVWMGIENNQFTIEFDTFESKVKDE